jgi:hypothetical protein
MDNTFRQNFNQLIKVVSFVTKEVQAQAMHIIKNQVK